MADREAQAPSQKGVIVTATNHNSLAINPHAKFTPVKKQGDIENHHGKVKNKQICLVQ